MEKIHYDLTNVHIFPHVVGEDGSISFGKPRRHYGAVSMDLAAQGNTYKLRADGMDYFVTNSNNGYQGDIVFAEVKDWFRQTILGDTLSETDKVLSENADASGTGFAMTFEFKGDKRRRLHVLYNCVASRPNIKGENKDNQKEADTESLSLTASPLENGLVKSSTTEETPESVIANWHKKVWSKDGDLETVEEA